MQIPTATEYVAALAAYVGYTESPAGSNCNRFSRALGRPCERWCADGLVAVAHETGLILPSTAAYTPTLAQGFKNVGRWHDKSAPGQVGDFAFFAFDGGRINHVECVEFSSKPGAELQDIGCNTTAGGDGNQANGGGVFRRTRTRSALVGFGRPAWRAVHPTNMFPSEGDDDMPRIVHSGGAIFAVGTEFGTFTDVAGSTRTGPWRRTFQNLSQLEQHLGGGGYTTKADGTAFDVTILHTVFETVYGDLGRVQP